MLVFGTIEPSARAASRSRRAIGSASSVQSVIAAYS
jgi:hypothetical protein